MLKTILISVNLPLSYRKSEHPRKLCIVDGKLRNEGGILPRQLHDPVLFLPFCSQMRIDLLGFNVFINPKGKEKIALKLFKLYLCEFASTLTVLELFVLFYYIAIPGNHELEEAGE